jgi:integrase
LRQDSSPGPDRITEDIDREGVQGACHPFFSPHDLRHRRISLLHMRAVPWARIGEQVGQRNLALTANTYTHVMLDEGELDYPSLLSSGRAGGE